MQQMRLVRCVVCCIRLPVHLDRLPVHLDRVAQRRPQPLRADETEVSDLTPQAIVFAIMASLHSLKHSRLSMIGISRQSLTTCWTLLSVQHRQL